MQTHKIKLSKNYIEILLHFIKKNAIEKGTSTGVTVTDYFIWTSLKELFERFQKYSIQKFGEKTVTFKYTELLAISIIAKHSHNPAVNYLIMRLPVEIINILNNETVNISSDPAAVDNAKMLTESIPGSGDLT
ncbi:MAG: hypothetical protein C0594_15370 [Marinilabiliales bacterium]|nr:MAG: hypothetical protein C0594_15370 [Marinilabiliales bacterium]